MMTETLPSILSDQLRSDEKLLWFGKPSPLKLATRRLMPVLFGIGWTVFVVFMYNFAQTNFFNRRPGAFDAPNIFGTIQPIFSAILLIFIGAGIWMILTPVRNYLKALNTYYAVTSKRALIISKLLSTNIISYGQRDLRSVRRVVHPDGSGDVIFGYDQHTYKDYHPQPILGQPQPGDVSINFGDNGINVTTAGPVTRTVTTAIGFFAIPDHQEVETLLVKTLMQEESR